MSLWCPRSFRPRLRVALVTAFTDEHIRALAAAGRYSREEVTRYVADTCRKTASRGDGHPPQFHGMRLKGVLLTCTISLYRQDKVATVTTYSSARANLKALCDEAASSREPVIIRRRGADDVALISAAELRSLVETAHLLRSPKNAERLLRALNRALGGKTRPQSVTKLRRDLDLDEKT